MTKEKNIPPGFKPSPLGPIPIDWEVKPVKKFGEVKRGAGSQYIKYVETGGIRLIRINDFFENNPVYIEPTNDIMRFAIEENDILFAGTGASAGASYIPKDEWLGFPHSYNAPRIRVKPSDNRYFLLYALQSDYIAKQQNELFVGAAQPFLDTTAIANFKILLPPLPEQRAIAACLSIWDNAITKVQALLAQKELRKKWLMQQLLTGKLRLRSASGKRFDGEWREYSLLDVAIFLNGKAYKQEELLDEGKYKVLRVGNFFTNSNWYYSDLELEDDKYVNDGDLMYAWSASFGPRYWTGEKTIYHYHIWKVIPLDLIVKDFLYYFLVFDTEKIFNNKQGGTMFHVTKGDMEKRTISIPEISEQTAIAQLLQAADKEIQLLKAKVDKLKEEKKGLMQVLLTGKIRVNKCYWQ